MAAEFNQELIQTSFDGSSREIGQSEGREKPSQPLLMIPTYGRGTRGNQIVRKASCIIWVDTP